MKIIDCLVRKLGYRFGPAVEPEFSRRSHERVEAARRRLKEAEERGEYQPQQTAERPSDG
jgi:hypothetical protein